MPPHDNGLFSTLKLGHNRWCGADPHLRHVDSPLVFFRAQYSFVYYSFSIQDILMRSYLHMVSHTTAIQKTIIIFPFLHQNLMSLPGAQHAWQTSHHGWQFIRWNSTSAKLKKSQLIRRYIGILWSPWTTLWPLLVFHAHVDFSSTTSEGLIHLHKPLRFLISPLSFWDRSTDRTDSWCHLTSVSDPECNCTICFHCYI